MKKARVIMSMEHQNFKQLYNDEDWEESAKIPHEVITAYNCTI